MCSAKSRGNFDQWKESLQLEIEDWSISQIYFSLFFILLSAYIYIPDMKMINHNS